MPPQFVSLMYHNVVRDDAAGARADTDGLGPSITSYFVGEAAFANQLDAVAQIADVLNYSDLQQFYFGMNSEQIGLTRPLLQLTFDDGWRGTFDIAGPILAGRGMQALVFVTTGLIGSRHFVSVENLAHLPPHVFHIGSHTISHRFLSELPDAEIRRELLHSRQTLEDIVGYAVDSVSIPNGAADARVLQIAGECGYRLVCVSDVHVNTRARGPLSIGRTAIRRTTTLDDIERYARGNLRREQLRSRVLSLPKRVLGAERYRRARSRLLGQTNGDREMSDLLQESTNWDLATDRAPAAAGRNLPNRDPSSGAMPCNGG